MTKTDFPEWPTTIPGTRGRTLLRTEPGFLSLEPEHSPPGCLGVGYHFYRHVENSGFPYYVTGVQEWGLGLFIGDGFLSVCGCDDRAQAKAKARQLIASNFKKGLCQW